MAQHEGENEQPVEIALSLTQKLGSRMLRLSCRSAICTAARYIPEHNIRG